VKRKQELVLGQKYVKAKVPGVKSCKEKHYLIIFDILEGVTDHTDAHVDEVRRSNLKHSLRKLLAIFVDFLQVEIVAIYVQ